ncbi:mRNA-capping enzyme subunit beta [Balamuthia mandrillaris]
MEEGRGRKRGRSEPEDKANEKESGSDSGDSSSSTTGGDASGSARSGYPPFKPSASFLGYYPMEDNLRLITGFVKQYIDRPNVEIEAKLGIIIDKHSNDRAHLGVGSETCVLSEGSRPWFRFQSSLSEGTFALFNRTLNQRFIDTKQPSYQGSPMKYSHFTEIDVFYNQPSDVRVTLDADRKFVKAIRKRRLGDLNFHCPRSPLDFRISASEEEPVPEDAIKGGRASHERKKERISYVFELYSFDLTKVQMTNNRTQAEETTYEMEIELLDMKRLFTEFTLAERNAPNSFVPILQGLYPVPSFLVPRSFFFFLMIFEQTGFLSNIRALKGLAT